MATEAAFGGPVFASTQSSGVTYSRPLTEREIETNCIDLSNPITITMPWHKPGMPVFDLDKLKIDMDFSSGVQASQAIAYAHLVAYRDQARDEMIDLVDQARNEMIDLVRYSLAQRKVFGVQTVAIKETSAQAYDRAMAVVGK